MVSRPQLQGTTSADLGPVLEELDMLPAPTAGDDVEGLALFRGILFALALEGAVVVLVLIVIAVGVLI